MTKHWFEISQVQVNHTKGGYDSFSKSADLGAYLPKS